MCSLTKNSFRTTKKLATLCSHDFTLYRNTFLYDGSDGETHNTLCFFLFGDDVNQQLKQYELKFSKYYFDKKKSAIMPIVYFS